MKLLFAVTQSEDAPSCMAALSDAGFVVTRLASSGGFLQQDNDTLMVGIEDARVDEAIDLIRRHCRERSQRMAPTQALIEPAAMHMPYQVEVEVGAATIFVVELERFERV